MNKNLFDTNIILDIALKRSPYYENAVKIFLKLDSKKIIGFVTASSITDIYYISKKQRGHEQAIAFILNLIEVLDILGVGKDIILIALKSGIKDFEDAIQACTAELNNIDIIITRNKDDFSRSKVKAYTPEAFLMEYDK
jgi:predicted nucleic acid-binding protein